MWKQTDDGRNPYDDVVPVRDPPPPASPGVDTDRASAVTYDVWKGLFLSVRVADWRAFGFWGWGALVVSLLCGVTATGVVLAALPTQQSAYVVPLLGCAGLGGAYGSFRILAPIAYRVTVSATDRRCAEARGVPRPADPGRDAPASDR